MNEKYGSYKDWIITALGDDKFSVGGYRVTYGEEGDYDTFDHYEDVMRYINQYMKDKADTESPEQKAARELREKAINREKKIDQILGE